MLWLTTNPGSFTHRHTETSDSSTNITIKSSAQIQDTSIHIDIVLWNLRPRFSLQFITEIHWRKFMDTFIEESRIFEFRLIKMKFNALFSTLGKYGHKTSYYSNSNSSICDIYHFCARSLGNHVMKYYNINAWCYTRWTCSLIQSAILR